ncbi:helix-hairpin-helix domain-containing protein [Castellaniella daejeonensis]|jgi:competence protein ComEA|uniref:Helix-hairpin-helix domain-containing protein n=1 Tax=Castellaniella daejeonensis TaxID=659013 RepID=A0ABN0TGU1_9BURK|nr:helix-hairpin-helix domain-containing protein [Castellaniella sp.]HET8703888.1 helix-hairpin-helix domain-containing protein [Castellaniella sp.]
MNPFLHDTAGVPAGENSGAAHVPAAQAGMPAAGRSARRVFIPGRRHPARSRAARRPARGLSRLLAAASLATLAWVGPAGAVDLNTATLDQLQGIRGIGPRTARIILDERERGGRYLSFADLSDRVRGIGPRRAQALQSAGLTIDGGGTRVSGQGRQAAAPAAKPAPGSRSPLTREEKSGK